MGENIAAIELERHIEERIAAAVLAERQRCAAIAICVLDDEDAWSDNRLRIHSPSLA